MSAPGVFTDLWPYLAALLHALLTAGVAGHALLTKRDEHAAAAWIALALLSPVAGTLLYLIFGINRIKRRATRLRGEGTAAPRPAAEGGDKKTPAEGGDKKTPAEGGDKKTPAEGGDGRTEAEGIGAAWLAHQTALARQAGQAPFTAGNALRPYGEGAAAEAMLEAIAGARNSVALASYIFNDDATGRRFVAALSAAKARGAEVRVLIDGVGAYYSIPPVTGRLARAGVPTRRFLHSFAPWRMPYLNLRSHRKILVVDGRTGFTGSANIKTDAGAASELHIRIDGPAVGPMMQTFADDWHFTCGEQLDGAAWFPPLEGRGSATLRGIASGPHEEHGAAWLALAGALVHARHSLKIVTPYFLPDAMTRHLLAMACARGVEIDIVIPARSNIFLIDWAASAGLDQLLEAGCRIWRQSGPFDHSKLALADGRWLFFGSSNWDPRSFYLNFEFDLEGFDAESAPELERLIAAKMARSRRYTLADWRARPLAVKLRDGAARLLRPYL